MKQQQTFNSFQEFQLKIKNLNLLRLMSLSRPIQWYNSQADQIWLNAVPFRKKTISQYRNKIISKITDKKSRSTLHLKGPVLSDT
jgi:hypothetical protein